jgi:transposase
MFTMDQTSLPSVRTKKHYSREFKSRVVVEARQWRVSIASVALSHGLNANLLIKWIQGGESQMASAGESFLFGLVA